ncbi:MAG: biopolymer transporter ExbD [Rhodocyclaceae bacterium]|nr:biopolymer transporter ExbD [Rhodocyclaceae bacterium]
MAFGSFETEGKATPMAEINTTPLVDVMLVLLVIFIITAPLFSQAVPVDLPRVASARLDEKPRTIQIAIDRDGQLYLDGQRTAHDALAAHLASLGAQNPELHLRADREVRYERVAEVLALAQRHGIVKIAFVTEAPRP